MTTIEERLEVLSRLPGDVVSLHSPDGEVRYVSPAIERTLGYPIDVYAELEMGALIHPDDRAAAADKWSQVVSQPGMSDRWELRMRHADGSWRWIEVIARNNLADPAIGAVFTNFRDVTERRQAEDALRASEARLRTVLQNSRDVTAVLGEDGQLVWVSPGIIAMLGWPDDQVTGMNAFDLVHPDDVAGAFDSFMQAIENDEAVDPVALRLRRHDGDWVQAEVAGTVWRNDDVLEGVVINVRDISWRAEADEVRRQSEERLHALVQNGHDGIVVLGPDGRTTYVSSTMEQMFGRTTDETMGRSGFEWIHPDDAERATVTLAGVFAEPGARASLHARAVHANGDYRWIEAVAVNLVDNPAVSGVVVNIRDVTERHRAEAALKASEERFRALVRFSGSVVQVLDDEAVIRWCSPSSAEVIGWTDDELVGRWVGEFCHPDDLDGARATFLEAAREPEGSRTTVGRVRHRDGTWRWIECTFTNRRHDPSIAGMVANFRDVTEQRSAEQALRESERLFRSLALSSPTGIFQQDASGDCIYVNQRWQDITGYTTDEALGHGWRRIVHPDDRARLGIDEKASPDPSTASAEFRVVQPSGEIRWVAVQTAPIFEDDGTFVGNVGAIEDVTDRVEAQRDSQRLTDIFDATDDLVAIADGAGTLLYLNRSGTRFFELGDGVDLAQFQVLDHLPPEMVASLTAELAPALEREGNWTGEFPLTRADGTVVPHLAQVMVHVDETGSPEFYSAMLHDISDRKAFEHRLAHQATHDPLTGLPNRTLLLDRLGAAIARARRNSRRIAVLFLDLDHFKVVNDSLGHGLGDRLLVAIANRLRTALRPSDTIARFGGDEFVVLCEDLVNLDDATAIADRVNTAISGPFVVDDAEVFVGVSIGIAYPDDPDADPETLIRDADAAMYQAKQRGRSRWVVFDNMMRAHAVDRLDIENALRRALERRELRVYYQPMVCLNTGAIHGVEALLRWEHPERGLLLPGDFITVAEETGLIVPIGAWVLDQACRQVQRWQASLPEVGPLTLSVNLSGRQLGHATLVDDVATVITDTGIDPASVELEITESVLMDDVEMSEETLGRLRRLGVKLVVDDFGTGYSSMSYLRRFPVDQLKVDRSFVDGLGSDPGDSAIVTAIVTLAHTLGLEAVAEGVESADQLAELRALGCDRAQGFHFARPAPQAAIAELLVRQPTW
jgi:diguanylate cyclase (GGDEF)-like protein/PAS domain S-box-containing protein